MVIMSRGFARPFVFSLLFIAVKVAAGGASSGWPVGLDHYFGPKSECGSLTEPSSQLKKEVCSIQKLNEQLRLGEKNSVCPGLDTQDWSNCYSKTLSVALREKWVSPSGVGALESMVLSHIESDPAQSVDVMLSTLELGEELSTHHSDTGGTWLRLVQRNLDRSSETLKELEAKPTRSTASLSQGESRAGLKARLERLRSKWGAKHLSKP